MSEHLMLKKLLGNITPEEEAAFQAWLRENPANEKLYQLYLQRWKMKQEEAPEFSPAPEKKKTRRTKVKRVRPRWFYVTEAIAVILILIATYLVYDGLKDQPQVYRSGKSMSTFYLPDSTEVTLKPQATVVVSAGYGEVRREVKLEGHAYFKVKPMDGMPFTVLSSNSRVEVLGTSFMVNSNREDQIDEVTVVNGKVLISSVNQPDEEVTLEEGSKGIVDARNRAVDVHPVNDENVTAWRDRKLVFENTSLDKVAEVLEEYFGKKISIENKNLLKCTLTRTFQDPTLEEVMDALRVSLNVIVLREYSQITLDGKGCSGKK